MLDMLAGAEGWWVGVVALVGLGLAFYAGWNWYMARSVAGARLVPIGQAQPGDVALMGQAERARGQELAAPLTGAPCLWFSYRVEEKRRSTGASSNTENWQEIQSGMSAGLLLLRDETGSVLLDPEAANISGAINESWRGSALLNANSPGGMAMAAAGILLGGNDERRYTEARIPVGARLFVLGGLADGTVRAPRRGPFVVSTEPPDHTARRYRWQVLWFGLAAAAVGVLVLLMMRSPSTG